MTTTAHEFFDSPRDLHTAGAIAVAVLSDDGRAGDACVRLLTEAGMHVSTVARLDEVAAAPLHGELADALVFACERIEASDLDLVGALAERLGARVRVLVAARPPQAHVIRRAVRSRIEGLVLAEALDRALVPTIHAVLASMIVLPAIERLRLETPLLSHREREVLSMAVDGFTNDEIGRRLFLATSTVKSHLSAAFAKLDVGSRKEAAAVFHDLISPEESSFRPAISTHRHFER